MMISKSVAVHVVVSRVVKLLGFCSRRIRLWILVATSSSSRAVSGTSSTRYQTSEPNTTCSRCSTMHYKNGSEVSLLFLVLKRSVVAHAHLSGRRG